MSKTPFVDQAARTRITTDLSTSLIVEAGAGSGKTHEMAARMAAGVAAGIYKVEHMAAVTFTRKAAAELRGRFQAALEAELLRDTPDISPSENVGRGFSRADLVRDALTNIERLFAGTIHAFCARLLRERPIEASVAPGFTELDDVDERIMREASWREFRAQARAAGDADLTLVNEAGIKAQDLDNAFAAICNYEDVEFPADDVPAPDVAGAWTALEEFWSELQRLMPVVRQDGAKCETLMKARRFERDWAFARQRQRTPARLAELLARWDFSPAITMKWWADDNVTRARVKATYLGLHEPFRTNVVSPWLEQWRRYLYAPCIRLLVKARDHAANERRQRNTLSFNDLLIRTEAVLRKDASVRRALQEKYRWLFVDEFQDTDPLQAEIMFLLAEGEGALFVVGDPKQSIYRFRRADIDIYNHVRREIGGKDDANVVSLTTNFRSVPPLCEWANQVFATKFPAVSDTYAPAFAPLAAEPATADDERRAAWSSRPPDSLFTLTSASPEEEAASIARYIFDEVTTKRRGYGDFLVLTRRKKGLRPLVSALEKLQIPIEVSGAGAFGESEEVRQLSQLLQALADPQNAVALVGVLRGPLFGLSDRDLFAFKQAGGYFGDLRGTWASAGDDVGDVRRARALAPPDPVVAALNTLSKFHRYTRVLPAGAALERILEDSGYLALAATSPGGVEAGDLLHAVDRVRAAVESGFTLTQAAEALVDAAQESTEIESWPLRPGRPDVVRLMNLHKAKGLEAPIVFLADPEGGK